jgi:hypothetical protein
MNIHKSQLFWGSLGTRVLTHPHIDQYAAVWWGSKSAFLDFTFRGVQRQQELIIESVMRYLPSGALGTQRQGDVHAFHGSRVCPTAVDGCQCNLPVYALGWNGGVRNDGHTDHLAQGGQWVAMDDLPLHYARWSWVCQGGEGCLHSPRWQWPWWTGRQKATQNPKIIPNWSFYVWKAMVWGYPHLKKDMETPIQYITIKNHNTSTMGLALRAMEVVALSVWNTHLFIQRKGEIHVRLDATVFLSKARKD